LKGCYIGNNIRLILDLIDYRHLIADDSFILFIDFYKVFDTVEHSFMFNHHVLCTSESATFLAKTRIL